MVIIKQEISNQPGGLRVHFALYTHGACRRCLPAHPGRHQRQLNLWTRSPILAAAISFAVGTIALVFYALVTRVPVPAAENLSRLPWWIWTGGILGAFFVASTVVLVPRMVAVIIAGQMITSLVLEHYGLLGYQPQPINVWRVIGIA